MVHMAATKRFFAEGAEGSALNYASPRELITSHLVVKSSTQLSPGKPTKRPQTLGPVVTFSLFHSIASPKSYSLLAPAQPPTINPKP